MTTLPPPPAYSAKPIPEVNILFLGSPGVGKSTFLSVLHLVQDGKLKPSDTASIQSHIATQSLPNPQTFSIKLFARPYTFHIYRSTGTLFVDPFPSDVSFVIIAYDVSSRASLHNAQYYWRQQFSIHYEARASSTPVMLLGLQRDLRTDEKDAETGEFSCVMPEEGLSAARKMHADRYGECSALTGELMWEVLEDITRTAALTTTESGGLSDGGGNCVVM